MRKTSLKVVVEIRINSITCPNARLDPSKWVHLRLCLMGSHLRSRLLKAQFPMKVEEKMRVERTFPLCSTASHLYSALLGEKLTIELVQLQKLGSHILALFSTELNDIIFENSHIIREKEIRTEHHTMILHTTHHFPGITNPHVNAVITVRLIQVNDPAAEIARDGGYNVTLGLKGSEYSNYQAPLNEPMPSTASHWSENPNPLRSCQKMAISRAETPKVKPTKRQIFCVRHVDDKLIGRTPSSDPPNSVGQWSKTNPGRLVKAPWYRSTSQMETVSSLLRRKPKVIRSTSLWEPEYETKCAWCIPDECQSDTDSITETLHSHQSRRPSNWESDESQCTHRCDGNFLQSPSNGDAENYWGSHNSEICTLCQLYYEYFGQYYPMHT